MHNIIVGNGEVGRSLYEVLKDVHETYIRGIEEVELPKTEVLNICFPYSKEFKKQVRKYQKMYKPIVTIIHSTVPIGTSRKLKATHSPIHGKHPNLAGGIKTFVKFVGGGDPIAIKFLNDAGIKTRAVGLEESEASKLWCTTYYGWNILFMKEVKRFCDEKGLNFNEVYGWNVHYNEGYEALSMGQFHRPMLDFMPGKIGGHCVVPNCKLLKSYVTKLIQKKNEQY